MKTLKALSRGSRGVPHCHGFTVLEIMIACVVAAILLCIAIPSYQGYLHRAKRSSAIELMLAVAACQERIYATEWSYDTRRCLTSDSTAAYRFSLEPHQTAELFSFAVIAEPVGDQGSDPCGSLSLDQSGTRSITGPDERTRKCWEGR